MIGPLSAGRIDPGLAGRAVIVTGAAGGLGRAYVKALTAAGADVVANDSARLPDGRWAADDLVADGAAAGRVVANHNTVATRSGGRAIVDHCLAAFGRVDGVVANAGVMRRGRYEEWTEEDFEALIGVHLYGSLWVTQAALAPLRAAGAGRIVFTASSAGLYGHGRGAAYAAAKGAVVALMRSLAQEVAGAGIAVNAVAPFAATAMTAGQWPGGTAQDFAPELVAPVVLYLLSEPCTLSGEVLTVGGGAVARVFSSTTRGWRATEGCGVDVASHIADIFDPDGAVAPRSVAEEFELLVIREGGSGVGQP